jgi:hypothetical protein
MSLGFGLGFPRSVFPTGEPTLNFQFAGSTTLDPLITFTRASTATYFNSAGTLTTAAVNEARFDYNPSTLAAQGLLIEEARTNLCLQSEDFATTWTVSQASISANATTAPSGAVTGDKLVENTATAAHSVFQNITISANTLYTATVYAKADTRTRLKLFWATTGNTSGGNVDFNLSAGTVASPNVYGTGSSYSATITAINNGWYRCSITGIIDASTTLARIRVDLLDAAGNASYTGDGTSGLFLWGAQVEAGAFLTSYIPTTTTALTRSADVASVNTLSPWFNSAEGTIYSEGGFASAPFVGGNRFTGLFAINDGTVNNYIGDGLRVLPGSSLRDFAPEIYVGGVAQFGQDSNNISENTSAKCAIAYKINDCSSAFSVGPVQITDTSASIPTVTQMQLGVGRGGQIVNGWIRRITYYPRRLSNADLQTITT